MDRGLDWVRNTKTHFSGEYGYSCKGKKYLVCNLLALHILDQFDTYLTFSDSSHAIDDISFLFSWAGFSEGSLNRGNLILATEEISVQRRWIAMSELFPFECRNQRGILNSLEDVVSVAHRPVAE